MESEKERVRNSEGAREKKMIKEEKGAKEKGNKSKKRKRDTVRGKERQ